MRRTLVIATTAIVALTLWTMTRRSAGPVQPSAAPADPAAEAARDEARRAEGAAHIRDALFAELQPVALRNCELARFGESHDGGYLVCGNLLDGVQSGYSYGIGGYDGWGCQISRTLDIPVHQYDCFNTTQPSCPGGQTIFHAECVAGETSVQDARPFDTMSRQLAANGDAGRRVVIKIDVEGAEWDAFLEAPDELLRRIDQLVVEFHQTDEQRFVRAVRRLKQHFHVAYLHFNNWSCQPGIAPFPAWAYEVLFVNTRIGVVEPSGAVRRPHPLDAPNNPGAEDCQG